MFEAVGTPRTRDRTDRRPALPRANRHFQAGQVWHLTHRCHRRQFLLKFEQDRRRWRYWLFQARKRYGLCVLNYTVTSNHVHLLVRDRGVREIAASMQLVAGRTAQEFNRRKNRHGAFWEDRYHATAVETDSHLARCLTYIDLNMVRAGVVEHPADWRDGGYRELLDGRRRYLTVDAAALLDVFDIHNLEVLQRQRDEWIASLLATGSVRDAKWTECIAVGSRSYVQTMQRASRIPANQSRVKNDPFGSAKAD